MPSSQITLATSADLGLAVYCATTEVQENDVVAQQQYGGGGGYGGPGAFVRNALKVGLPRPAHSTNGTSFRTTSPRRTGWRCYGWGWRRRCWRCPYGRCGPYYGGGGGGGPLNKRDVADDKTAEAVDASADEPAEVTEDPADNTVEGAPLVTPNNWLPR